MVINEFLQLAQAQTRQVLVAQYPEQSEINAFAEGHGLIKGVANALGIEAFSLDPPFRAALARGENPYRDNIHSNDLGQTLLATALFDALAGVPALNR